MAQIKCKMCGGTINIESNSNVVECEFCGTRQTMPSLDNEKLVILNNRANTLRIKNDFVKAMLTYENIIDENPKDAEAHWGLVLCRYGIEYVDDPKTGKKIPTCHRTQYKSIFDDIDYQAAIEHSDVLAKDIYKTEAEEINRIQKEILSISQKEDPYDIFICYKELDDNGNKTKDSVIAQEVYDNLISKGYKVFFSKISLESKLGSQYEPHIFAALNSAKVMIVIGTKAEHFAAPWVKNEWSRFISIMEEGKDTKYVIPCYKDMDVYELPDELVVFQCQDINQIGFIQDLTRGVDKIFGKNYADINISENLFKSNINALLERSEMLLSNGLFPKAKETLNEVLTCDPKNVRAYLLLVLVDLELNTLEDLEKYNTSIDFNSNLSCAIRFANEEERKQLNQIKQKIALNVENIRKQEIYDKAIEEKNNHRYEKACVMFKSIAGFLDASEMSKECLTEAQEMLYKRANTYFENKEYKLAIDCFKKIINYKDSKAKIEICENCSKGLLRKKEHRNFLIGGSSALGIILLILLFILFIPLINRNNAIKAIESGNYKEASEYFERYDGLLNNDELIDINDAIRNCSDRYNLISALYEKGVYVEVRVILDDNGNTETFFINDQLNTIFKNKSFNEINVVREGYNLQDFQYYDMEIELNSGEYKCTIIVNAVWAGLKYNINYKNVENAYDFPSSYTCGHGRTIPNPTKFGYTFVGWQVEGTDIIIKDLVISKTDYGHKTYVAVWEVTRPLIIFDSAGGSFLDDLTLNVGDPVVVEDPVREGYTFVGWSPKLPETMTNDILYVTALWEVNSYAITFDVNGGIELQDDILTVTYGGAFNLPTPKHSEKTMQFNGWYNGEIKIESGYWFKTENVTLVAMWVEVPLVYEENGVKYANIGKYPQSVVTNSSLITELNQITTTNEFGYIEYKGEEYKKLTGAPYLGNEYKFNNGDTIIKGVTYYFKVEPIKWRVLTESNGTYKLLSEFVLDKMSFYGSEQNRTIDGETIYPNNYMYSNVRAWLNSYNGASYSVSNYTNKGFYDIVFDEEEKSFINTTLVDNSLSTTNSYEEDCICPNTNDKIYLLSVTDVKNKSYGFNTNYFNEDECRKAVTTDYVRCKGIWINTSDSLYGHCHWMLRSPYTSGATITSKASYTFSTIYIDTTYNNHSYVSQGYYGVRPAMDVTFNG